MGNLYCGLEQLKRAASINGTDQDARLLRIIEGESRRIDSDTRRRFIPETATRRYQWPPLWTSTSWRLWLSHDILSVSTLQTKAEDSSPTTIAATDYFLEPQHFGPPYNRIEIDLSSTAAFEGGATSQRSILVTGSWAHSNDTKAAGTVASGLASDAAATSMVCSDGSLIDTGDTLLISTEQLYVSARAASDTTTNTSGTLAADMSVTSVTVGDGTQVCTGEIILVNSERMYVEAVAGAVLTVVRAYDGSTLASHADAQDVYAYRALTVTRGANGTTAAVHTDATAINKYAPPADITQLCMAASIVAYQQETAGWGRSIGVGDGAVEFRGSAYKAFRDQVVKDFKKAREAAI